MSQALAKWANHQRQNDRAKEDDLKPGELRALHTLQREAEEKGTTLQNDGKGGLPPSLVLGVLRRDDYACACTAEHGLHDDREKCGTRDQITLHHLGGIAKTKWLSRQGHSNDPKNILTTCAECHDKMHEQARERGDDSSQVTPEGDKGNPRRDKGLPDANPKA